MKRLDRRAFLGTSAGGLAALGAASLAQSQDSAGGTTNDPGRPDTLFLTWQRDPTTTMTAQWVGPDRLGDAAAVHFAPRDANDWQTVPPRVTDYPMSDLKLFRAEFTGLKPGREYQFRIDEAQTPNYFRTMPAKATDSFSFVSGGDCGVNEHAIANNKVAARQDPMFALIGGDLGYDNGRDVGVSLRFLQNYSQHMVDTQGRLIPMVVCIGNHEVSGGFNAPRSAGPFYFALHDGLYPELSYATLDFGDYLSLVLLDTGHVSPITGEQTDWLGRALAERVDRPHLIVCNHVPAYPSVRPWLAGFGSGLGNRTKWVPLFEKYNVDLVLEHHDHAFKRTHPLKDGHVDKNGILYLGDGSWGKLRVPATPAERPYLATVAEKYHLTLHRLEGEQRFHMAIDDRGTIIDVCRTTKKPRRAPRG